MIHIAKKNHQRTKFVEFLVGGLYIANTKEKSLQFIIVGAPETN